MTKKIKVALIDFDGTLFDGQSMPFIWKRYGELGYSRIKQFIALSKILPDKYFSKKKIFKNITVDSYKNNATNHMVKMFKDFTENDMLDFFNRIIESLETKYNPYVLKRIKELQSENYKIILISGSFNSLIDIVAKRLNIDYSFGTKLLYFENGKIDSKTKIDFVKEEFKVQELFKAVPKEIIDYDNSYSFSDSISDLDILNVVKNKEIINPDSLLEELAIKNSWKITKNNI